MSTRGRKADIVPFPGARTEPMNEVEVPAHIKPEMHGEWIAIVNDLIERGVLNDAMMGTVEAYVCALSQMRSAQEALDKFGPLVDNGKGVLKVNPASGLFGKAQEAVLRLFAELGLTPASRSRKKMTTTPGSVQESLFDV